MARTIQSPGVEVKEVDLSLRPQLPTGTTVFIPGFANQGPTDELLTLSSLSEFEQVYGLPANAAERYMYHSVKAAFQSPANVLVSRLPYGTGAGATVADKFSVQVFPVIPRPIMVDSTDDTLNTVENNKNSVEDIVNGNWYRISTIGQSTDFTKYGASSNAIGTDFQAVFTEEQMLSGGGTVEPLIAWYPTELGNTDETGDLVIEQGASATFGTATVTTVDTGSDTNTRVLQINVNAGENSVSYDPATSIYNLNAATADLSPQGLVEIINQNPGAGLAASGGEDHTFASLELTPGEFNIDGGDPSTGSLTLQSTVPGFVSIVITGRSNVDETGTPTGVAMTINELIAADGLQITATGGGADEQLQIGASITLEGGALADGTISASGPIALTGGQDARFSTKVVPYEDWVFGETAPDGDYTATTLKDAVDSVLRAMSDDTLFGQPLSDFATDNLFWTEQTAGDPTSIPAHKGYQIPEIADMVAEAVNAVGWDLASSDRYYLGEPSNIELSNDEFQKTVKGEIKMKETGAGKLENQRFTSYNDLLTKGGAGLMIVNDKKFVINEKFEGYYIGLSDNTNLNPASDFDSVGKLKSLSKKLGGTTGGYVDVPDDSYGTKSRLTFSLSAGFLFDQYGNKQQVGLDGSMSEVMENLSEFDLNTEEFTDVLTLAVFKVRQSTLEPDATKLDYLVADSVIGSVNYFRERFLSTGGTAVSYFIESEAENSNNLFMKMNEGIAKTAGNWLDETGYPTRSIRILPAKDVRYYDELTDEEKAARQGETEEEKRTVNDFKVSQGFLNGREETSDRLYIKSWQDLQRSGAAQIKHGQNVYPHGVYRKQQAEAKETGNIPAKLDRIFELADNFDLFPIDITCESGLGTIYVGSKGGTQEYFDDEEYFNIGDHAVSSTGLSGNGLYQTKIIDNRNELDFLVNYDTIFDTFKGFSQFARKDNIFIADPLRYIFVQGRNSKTLTSKQREAGVNFSQHIYWPLRHMMTGGSKNSSYCATYANWGFTNDKALNRPVWVPMSGFAAAAMANTDSDFYPWIAPAGFTRGLVSGIQDLAFYPKQKERDQLYKIGLNPIANFPNEGFAIFGQKTMQAKPSAFDRINVRRLFLYLQKAVMNTIKFFVFEPNTLFTRTQVLNVLRPIFEEVKNTQGLYDYLIVCDDRNNSSDVIDRNELVVDIYIKPTRAAEFILVNFYATRTGQDFSELVT